MDSLPKDYNLKTILKDEQCILSRQSFMNLTGVGLLTFRVKMDREYTGQQTKMQSFQLK